MIAALTFLREAAAFLAIMAFAGGVWVVMLELAA